MSTVLPAGFEHLEPFLGWALETEPERAARRATSRFEDVKAFYDAAFPTTEAALDHLKDHRLEQLPAPSRTLLLLMLSFVEAALAVENYGQVTVPNACEVSRFEARTIGGSF
ncbi:hypothetical protein DFR24_2075 [Panacagrimonas perspica]|uniref:Uncharacterized protein n=1 Tax=Panacagrimonas perspica TaxID=381431 RepID=A0A4S3KB17_9GAMM|nr:hypothetical protein [Panacagrimonas perspica]TDU32675.1 hypothetical protein DFR24_2075 [Panacagrimonas perspica]THD05560.1 hypothetical protein B1810_02250 [Panacagrimonas perspica]